MFRLRFIVGPLRLLLPGIALMLALCWSPGLASEADAPSEEALALYADAANFQTNGALPLAIETWKKFLEQFPDSPLVPKAAHYLGVCYMQRDEPDLEAAIVALRRAAEHRQSELRQESLVNLGWCLLATAADDPAADEQQRQTERLEEALETFRTLLKEAPRSKYADRALFYGGEAAYALGNAESALKFYDSLLGLDSAQDSPLRCDAHYARGIVMEELDRPAEAINSFRRLVEDCHQSPLVADALIRLGDASIALEKYDDAIRWLGQAAEHEGTDQPYALLRQAYALVQVERPAEASALYEQLVEQFPDSPHASDARLASAQASYRAGELDEAAKRFQRVLSSGDPVAATEAAHWLATIAIGRDEPQQAIAVANQQIESGLEGPYRWSVQLDLAEATMMLPDQTEEALRLYGELYRRAPDSPVASRALYNAAFAALQLQRDSQAAEMAGQFLDKFADDPLALDVRYILAESTLRQGDAAAAAEQYQQLIAEPASEGLSQRPLWVMRTAAALSSAGQTERAIEVLEGGSDGLTATQRAEAQFMIGSLHLDAGRGQAAVEALQASLKSDPHGSRAAEATVQLGQAHLLAGDETKARRAWQEAIKRYAEHPSSDQARYRMAVLAARSGDHQTAARRYQALLDSALQPSLVPAALYGLGWNRLQADAPAEAIEPLRRLLSQHAEHALAADARLALGMCLRLVDQPEQAAEQLRQCLEGDPPGNARGHALFELALIDLDQQRPAEAVERLQQLIADVPDYHELDKALYELAWTLKDLDRPDDAEQRFSELIRRAPESSEAAQGHYFIGNRRYADQAWEEAAQAYQRAGQLEAASAQLRERAAYRRGWALHKAGQFQQASEVFAQQAEAFPDGNLIADALLMAGEGLFQQTQYKQALAAYERARQRMVQRDERAETLQADADRQVRELVLLHGGQCLMQLERWDDARGWFKELASRFPTSRYLPQAEYETAFALQRAGQDDEALRMHERVANAQRNELGARSRFMMGEIHFARRDFSKALPEFQRVMYGYGADQAPPPIRNWQAKSGYEAGRCAELMIQEASRPEARSKAAEYAVGFFQYVIQQHPQHELAPKSQQRLEVLGRMGLDVSVGANASSNSGN